MDSLDVKDECLFSLKCGLDEVILDDFLLNEDNIFLLFTAILAESSSLALLRYTIRWKFSYSSVVSSSLSSPTLLPLFTLLEE